MKLPPGITLTGINAAWRALSYYNRLAGDNPFIQAAVGLSVRKDVMSGMCTLDLLRGLLINDAERATRTESPAGGIL